MAFLKVIGMYNMNNVEYPRKVMIEYALKLVQLALANNYILYYKDTECRNIVWDCQCSLMEWNNYILAPQAKIDFFSKDELAYSYAYQL